MIKRYVDFTVWNIAEERQATKDEIEAYVRIRFISDGKCEIEADEDYSVFQYD